MPVVAVHATPFDLRCDGGHLGRLLPLQQLELTEASCEVVRAQFSQIRYLSLFVLPEAIAVLGVFVWWSRRQAASR